MALDHDRQLSESGGQGAEQAAMTIEKTVQPSGMLLHPLCLRVQDADTPHRFEEVARVRHIGQLNLADERDGRRQRRTW